MIALRILPPVVLAALLAAAAIGDLRTRTISNRLNLAVAAAAAASWATAGYGLGGVAVQVAMAVAALLVFGGCFAAGLMGGGDVKLIVGLALALPPLSFATMLAWMAIGGGALTLAMLALAGLRRAARAPEIPYGVAIAGAGLLVLANDILTTRAA